MSLFVTLQEIKDHLIIEHDLDDNNLTLISESADDIISSNLRRPLNEIASPSFKGYRALKVAVLTLIGTWYANKESTSVATIKEVPHSCMWILDHYRKYNG